MFVNSLIEACKPVDQYLMNPKGYLTYYETNAKGPVYHEYLPFYVNIHDESIEDAPIKTSKVNNEEKQETEGLSTDNTTQLKNIQRCFTMHDEKNQLVYYEEYNTFSECLYVFYQLYDQTKNELKEMKERKNVNSKVLKIQEDQYSRIEQLKEEEYTYEFKAELIHIISILLILLSFISTSCWQVE